MLKLNSSSRDHADFDELRDQVEGFLKAGDMDAIRQLAADRFGECDVQQSEDFRKWTKRKSSLTEARPIPSDVVRSILVVDDNVVIRRTVQNMCLRLLPRDQIETVSDGDEALSSVLKACPDLIILDNTMPKLNGEVVAKVLRIMGFLKVQIVGCTCDFEAVKLFHEAGADGILEKTSGVSIVPLKEALIHHLRLVV